MEKIGKYLRLIREEKGLSLRKLGEMIDVSHNRLGKFERGEEKPSIEMIEKIESVLGILIDNCKEIENEINSLLDEFLEAQFHNQKVLDEFEERINSKRKTYENHLAFEKIILLEYMICVLKKDFASAEKKDAKLKIDLSDAYARQAYLQYKGVYYFLKDDFEKAISYLLEANNLLHDDKRLAMIALHLSMVYKHVNRLTLSIGNLKYAKTIFVKYSSYNRAINSDIELAGAYATINLTNEAVEIYRSILKAMKYLDAGENNKRVAVRNLSWVLLRAGRYAESLENLEPEMAVTPHNPLAVLYYLWCQYRLGNYQMAEKIIAVDKKIMENSIHNQKFKLISSLDYAKDAIPNKQLLGIAIRVFEELQYSTDTSTLLFYVDIIINMLKVRNNDKDMLIKYMDIKLAIMSNESLFVK